MELQLIIGVVVMALRLSLAIDVYSKEGSIYTFVCPHRNTSLKSVIWQFTNKSGAIFPVSDGTYISSSNPASDRLQIIGNHSGGEYNLKLSGLQLTDEGLYRCSDSFEQMEYYLLPEALPENVHGEEGSSFLFVCPYNKMPTNNVVWQFTNKTGRVFSVSDGLWKSTQNPAHDRVEVVGDHSSGEYNLRLSNLKELDSGVYSCSVSVRVKEFFFNLIASPSDLILSSEENDEIIGTEGQSLTINCTAIGGRPPPDVRLEIDNQVINGTQSVKYTIPLLYRSYDKKLVKCQATNDALESAQEKTAILYLYLKPSLPVFNQEPPRTNDTKPLVATCTSTGSRPASEIYWKIKDNPVNVRIVQQNTSDPSTETYTVVSTLTYSVDRSYNGQPITCGVTHQTLSQGLEATQTISVHYAPDVTVSNKAHTQSDPIRTIQCTADGNPDQYIFYKWQHRSELGEVIRELDGGQDGVLKLPSTFQSSRYQDSGEYICTVSNGIGDRNGRIKQTGYGHLEISAQPVFTLDNNESITQYGEYGQSTNINVYVYCIPKYTHVTWYKENTALATNDKYRMTEIAATVRSGFHGVVVQVNGFLLKLTISNLTEDDIISYKIRISNDYGNVEHTVVLESLRAPDTPANFIATVSSTSSISLQWDPGFNGGQDQTFHVEYRMAGSITWLIKDIPTNQQTGRQTFLLSRLEEGTSYEIRIYAENKLNKSLPTDIKLILTMKAVKESQIPSNAIIGGVAGALFAIIVIISVVFYLRKKGCGFRRHSSSSCRKEEAVHEKQQNGDMYEQIDEAATEFKDISKSYAEDKSTAEHYERLGAMSKPDVYDNLQNKYDISRSKTEDKSTVEHYETLGAKNKPNVYGDLQNKHDVSEKEYAYLTV